MWAGNNLGSGYPKKKFYFPHAQISTNHPSYCIHFSFGPLEKLLLDLSYFLWNNSSSLVPPLCAEVLLTTRQSWKKWGQNLNSSFHSCAKESKAHSVSKWSKMSHFGISFLHNYPCYLFTCAMRSTPRQFFWIFNQRVESMSKWNETRYRMLQRVEPS